MSCARRRTARWRRAPSTAEDIVPGAGEFHASFNVDDIQGFAQFDVVFGFEIEAGDLPFFAEKDILSVISTDRDLRSGRLRNGEHELPEVFLHVLVFVFERLDLLLDFSQFLSRFGGEGFDIPGSFAFGNRLLVPVRFRIAEQSHLGADLVALGAEGIQFLLESFPAVVDCTEFVDIACYFFLFRCLPDGLGVFTNDLDIQHDISPSERIYNSFLHLLRVIRDATLPTIRSSGKQGFLPCDRAID